MNASVRKRLVVTVFLLAFFVTGGPRLAPAQKAPAPPAARPKAAVMKAAPKWRTLTGEIVDMGCYTTRGFKGAAHRDCGTQCVRSGVPRGLLTAGDTVYVLTQHHDRAMAPTNFPPPDPFALCGTWVSQQVEISGPTWEGAGTRFLEVRSAKLVPPESAAP